MVTRKHLDPRLKIEEGVTPETNPPGVLGLSPLGYVFYDTQHASVLGL